MCWEGNYNLADAKFCCLYHLREDEEFKSFERQKLLGNKLFFDFKQVEEKKGVYVFDMSDMKADWQAITKGKYSQMSVDHKKRIRHYIGLNSPNLPYIDSFLYPERHFKLYSELMGVTENILKEVGELCNVPDHEQETLRVSILNLEIVKENT